MFKVPMQLYSKKKEVNNNKGYNKNNNNYNNYDKPLSLVIKSECKSVL